MSIFYHLKGVAVFVFVLLIVLKRGFSFLERLSDGNLMIFWIQMISTKFLIAEIVAKYMFCKSGTLARFLQRYSKMDFEISFPVKFRLKWNCSEVGKMENHDKLKICGNVRGWSFVRAVEQPKNCLAVYFALVVHYILL